MASPSASDQAKQGLSWMEWLQGWSHVIYELFFQRIEARYLKNPLPLPPLNDLTCIVTGSTSGIGLEIARQLAESGANVVMAVRNPTAAHSLIQTWQNETSSKDSLNIDVMELNLLSLESVVRFSETWDSLGKPLNVLINNAGIFSMGEPQKFSNDGYETHMQVNHLAPALLSLLLLPSLKRGAPSRIINVNSVIHFVSTVDPNDMNFVSRKREFSSLAGYSTSKLAQVMFSNVLHKRLPSESEISIICVGPGCARTNIERDVPKFIKEVGYRLFSPVLFNAEEASRSALFAATDPEIPKYCAQLRCDEWPACAYISSSCCPMNPSNEARRLDVSSLVWEKTLDMVGLSGDCLEILLEGKEIQCRYGAHLK
ncbi:dehydrogenase/reductase SDR family member FEY-like [Rhododendron vialii]|uniref:dehydrogenase/reductase SDR family member FEY-like n=1 Tax=Rhododendron vialii TaxID=182163 RepID=UPI00265E760E|nr:dehydrogenase/reductase SDR family member FEY-like [Rhododendron vialii]